MGQVIGIVDRLGKPAFFVTVVALTLWGLGSRMSKAESDFVFRAPKIFRGMRPDIRCNRRIR